MFDFDKGIRAAIVLALCSDLRFDKTKARCHSCGNQLEVRYCEEKVYAVRCKKCETVSIIMASNPQKAAEHIGYMLTSAHNPPFNFIGEESVGCPFDDPNGLNPNAPTGAESEEQCADRH